MKQNKLRNKKYISNTKILLKILFNNKINIISTSNFLIHIKNILIVFQLKNIQNTLYSIFDKGVQKNIFHLNEVIRKKQRVNQFLLKKNLNL